ncbi:hypothetical protein [Saccharopolyspora spinosa]|nr:hypothetical protein [Saccharopolyspora spinosa]
MLWVDPVHPGPEALLLAGVALKQDIIALLDVVTTVPDVAS